MGNVSPETERVVGPLSVAEIQALIRNIEQLRGHLGRQRGRALRILDRLCAPGTVSAAASPTARPS